MKIQRIKRATASDQVFKALHDLILSGEIRPGDRLPSQKDLAERFEVSRSTLREAIHKLAALGFVVLKHGVGTVVADGHPLRYVASLEDHFLLDGISAGEFLEARFIIETAVVRLAVERAAEEHLLMLQEILSRQGQSARCGKLEEFSILDTEFHLTLARASGNKLLVKLEETILELLRQFIRKVSELPGAVEDALAFHTRIADALRRRDAQDVEHWMSSHLMDVAQRLKHHLGVKADLDQLLKTTKTRGGSKQI